MGKRALIFGGWLLIAVLQAGCVTGVARDINGEADRMRLGDEAFEARDYTRAREHYTVAVQEAPNNTQALFRLGNIALYEGRPEAAQEFYERTLAIDPQFARAHYNLAVIYLGRAEDHFNYYAATLDSGRSIDAPLVRLLADLEAFATKDSAKEQATTRSQQDPLDSLGEFLGTGAPAP
ncbi:MAG: tetratricopeptide repeat protein [Pseudomonadota bacterium]